MPPKIKTDRDAIINAAFQIAKNESLAAITAQSVSTVLDTSVAPIFREFQTIEELRTATAEKINVFHTEYIKSYPLSGSEFLTYGVAYIHFAKEYPHLFETIMQPSRISIIEQLSGSIAFIVNSAGNESGLNVEQSKDLFFNVWVYTHGIACLVYKGSLVMEENKVKRLLMDAFSVFAKHHKECETPQTGDLQ